MYRIDLDMALYEDITAVIATQPDMIRTLVTKPSITPILWSEFLRLPLVRFVIVRGNHSLFQYLCQVQKPKMMYSTAMRPDDLLTYVGMFDVITCKMSASSPHELCYHTECHRKAVLKPALFLLPHVDMSVQHRAFLWTTPCRIAEHSEWWYALFQRRWSPHCVFSSIEARSAFATGKERWNTQRHWALLVFVLVRRALGRDVARVIAENVLKTYWFC